MNDPICNERGIPQSECPPFCPHDFGLVVGNAEYVHDGLRTRIAALRDEWATEGASLVRNCSTGRDVNEGEQMQACARALTDLLAAEFEDDALEMARKADAAERRAEEAEYHVEQLRDARDRAEVLAERLANDAALVRLAQAEALRTAAREFVTEMTDVWGGDSQWLTTGTRVAEVVACTLREMAADLENGDDPIAAVPCAHEWLDRPESDTRECLICGAEVAG